MQIVPVVLRSESGKEVSTYALLDAGSHVTLVRDDVAKKLELSGKSRSINIGTIKEKPTSMLVKEINLSVISKSGDREVQIRSAYSVPRSEFKMPSQPCPARYDDPDVYTHLDGLEFEPIGKDDITILIGANNPDALLVEEVRRGRDNEPLAVRTILGWSLFGSSNPGHELNVTVSLLHRQEDVVSPIVEGLLSRNKPDKLFIERNNLS